ncbi:hypothetical protein KKE06_05795 [Candidatus Micrarchaeota archaeon]|nr:hypothetical protein [Candidatus Micrarchaeota archaeon]
MHQGLGFSYSTIFLSFKEDYCEFNYPAKGLKEHAEIILQNLKENPNYLKEKRNQYNQEVAAFENDYKIVETKIEKLSENELFDVLHRLGNAIETGVGTAHMIEGISIRLEHEIRHFLMGKVKGKQLNEAFSTLTAPTAQSYLNYKEELLWNIKNALKEKQKELALKFIERFYWITTNFTGNTILTIPEVLKEANRIKKFQKPDFDAFAQQKKILFEQYGFSEREKKWIEWAEFLTEWQDERKEKMYKAVFSLAQVLQEVSKRYKIDLKILHYLLPFEITPTALQNKTAQKTAKKRFHGALFSKSLGKTLIFDGPEFTEFEKAIHQQHEDVEKITGTGASLGLATGPVKICTNIKSLEKVQEGDVLVASMTRPEYVSAMKKACAIVTDEGGVTCHAAIVGRELGIPCVIGTKNASKVLKDNWIVQVKANHGEVVVLEKTEQEK